MVKADSVIIEYIHLSKSTQYQKGVCDIQQARKSETHDLRRCNVNDGLRGTKGTENGKSSYKRQAF